MRHNYTFSGLIYLNRIFSRQPSAVGYKTNGMGTCRATANNYTGLIYLNQVSHTQERKANMNRHQILQLKFHIGIGTLKRCMGINKDLWTNEESYLNV